MRVERVLRGDGDVVEEAEAHRPRGSAWWPGGRSAEEAASARSPPSSASTARPLRPPRAVPPRTTRAGDRVEVDRPAAGRGQRADARRCTRAGWTRLELPSARPPAPRRRSQPSQSARASSSSIATMRAARSGCARVSCSSDERGDSRTRRGHRATVPYAVGRVAADRRPRRRRRRGRRAVRGADAPPAPGARVRWCPHAARASRPATGRRAASPPRSPPTTRRERHLDDTLEARAAAPCAPQRRAGAHATRRPTRVRDLEQLGVRFDADRHGNLALGLEGGHSRAPRRPRRRQRHRPPDRRASCRRSSPLDPASRCSSAARAAALCVRGRPRRRRSSSTTGRDPVPRAHRSSPPAARPRSGRARPTRPARSAAGCCSRTPPAPRWPTWSSCSSTHGGRRRQPRARDGFLITEAIRGEGATLLDARRRALRRRARAARRGRARDRGRARSETGARRVDLDMRAIDPAAVPEHRRGPARGRHRPDARARCPSRPPRHYMMGGIVDRPRRARDRCRACTPSASAPAPACTAPTGSRPTRSRECFVFGRRAALAALDEPARAGRPRGPRPPTPSPQRPAAQTRRALCGARGHRARRRRPAPLLDDPHPLARLVGAAALCARGEPRRHLRRPTPRARTPRSRAPHCVVAHGDVRSSTGRSGRTNASDGRART